MSNSKSQPIPVRISHQTREALASLSEQTLVPQNKIIQIAVTRFLNQVRAEGGLNLPAEIPALPQSEEES